MPDEVTDRAGWLAHPFCFPRFNDRVRTRGVSHPQPQVPIWSLLLAPLTSLVPFLRPLLMLGSVTGMMSPLLSLQPHFRTPPHNSPPNAQRPPLTSYGTYPKHTTFRVSQMLPQAVTKPSGARGPYLSCQSGGSVRAGPGCLPSFLFHLGTWHRVQHIAETPRSFVLAIKKPRIRNSACFQSKKSRNSLWKRMLEGSNGARGDEEMLHLGPLDWEEHEPRIPQAQRGLCIGQQYKWELKTIGVQGCSGGRDILCPSAAESDLLVSILPLPWSHCMYVSQSAPNTLWAQFWEQIGPLKSHCPFSQISQSNTPHRYLASLEIGCPWMRYPP